MTDLNRELAAELTDLDAYLADLAATGLDLSPGEARASKGRVALARVRAMLTEPPAPDPYEDRCRICKQRRSECCC